MYVENKDKSDYLESKMKIKQKKSQMMERKFVDSLQILKPFHKSQLKVYGQKN